MRTATPMFSPAQDGAGRSDAAGGGGGRASPAAQHADQLDGVGSVGEMRHENVSVRGRTVGSDFAASVRGADGPLRTLKFLRLRRRWRLHLWRRGWRLGRAVANNPAPSGRNAAGPFRTLKRRWRRWRWFQRWRWWRLGRAVASNPAPGGRNAAGPFRTLKRRWRRWRWFQRRSFRAGLLRLLLRLQRRLRFAAGTAGRRADIRARPAHHRLKRALTAKRRDQTVAVAVQVNAGLCVGCVTDAAAVARLAVRRLRARGAAAHLGGRLSPGALVCGLAQRGALGPGPFAVGIPVGNEYRFEV
eukprot:COSAG04_NODE_4740_length_1917_cov_1.557206_2_plen_301_part_00